MKDAISIAGSWPPPPPPSWYADPYGTPHTGAADRLPGEEACAIGWYWEALTGTCEPGPHELCATPAYWSWERFERCLYGSPYDCTGATTGINEQGIAVGGCVPSPCDDFWAAEGGGWAWNWNALDCVEDAKPQPQIGAGLGSLARGRPGVGHYEQRQPRMHGLSGHHPTQMRPGKRRTVRDIANRSDATRAAGSDIVGKRLANGSWVRVSPMRTAVMPSSLRGVRRYNQMVAGVSVAGPAEQGMAWQPHLNPVSSSVRGARAFDQMAARRMVGPTRRAAHRRQMTDAPYMGRSRPAPSPLRAGASIGGSNGQGPGVFYGVQNPVRAGMRRREYPSGWQHGYPV